IDITVNPVLVGEERDRRVGIAPGYELLVQQITPGSIADKAGFKAADQILSIDGVPTMSAATYFEQLDTSAARAVVARVKRGSTEVALTIPPRPDVKSAANVGLALTTGFQLSHP